MTESTRIEKRHNAVLTEVFASKSAYDKHAAECAEYKPQFNKFIELLKNDSLFVRGRFGTFVPYIQTVRLDMLASEDWAHGISDNSVFIDFEINLREKSIQVINCGHIYLTDADKKKSYLCMCSMKDAHKATGGKWMRKSKYKSIEEAAGKIVKFYDEVRTGLESATGGYPFKQMQIDIY